VAHERCRVRLIANIPEVCIFRGPSLKRRFNLPQVDAVAQDIAVLEHALVDLHDLPAYRLYGINLFQHTRYVIAVALGRKHFLCALVHLEIRRHRNYAPIGKGRFYALIFILGQNGQAECRHESQGYHTNYLLQGKSLPSYTCNLLHNLARPPVEKDILRRYRKGNTENIRHLVAQAVQAHGCLANRIKNTRINILG